MDNSLKSRIEKRAYELFLHRGSKPGFHFDDWVKAEKEVLAEKNQEKGTSTKANDPPSKKKTVSKKK